MQTKNGVCYDLENSPFMFSTAFFCYSFSSGKHLEKFKDNVDKRRDWLTDSMSRRFHFYIDMSLVAELQLYMQVETRGFFIVSNSGKVYKCPENLELGGLKVSGED